MCFSQQLKKRLFTRKSIFIFAFLVTMPLSTPYASESSLSRQKIDIFRKAVSQLELNTLELSPSKQGKQAICHLSNKKIKVIWIDEKVLDKIEERTVLKALQKGFKDKKLVCSFTEVRSNSALLDGVVSAPQKGQIIFHDVVP